VIQKKICLLGAFAVGTANSPSGYKLHVSAGDWEINPWTPHTEPTRVRLKHRTR
jgi:hypothetical protein